MSKRNTVATTVEAGFCQEDHLHVTLKNRRGSVMAELALDIEDALDLVQGLLEDLEDRTGLMLMLIDPDDVVEDDCDDEIGPVRGHC